MPCTGALKVGWGSSGRSGIAAGPRWLGYTLLLLEHLELVVWYGGTIPFIHAIIALQLALVIVQPPLGCWFALFIPLPFFGWQIYGCTSWCILYHAFLFCMCHPLKDNGWALVCKQVFLYELVDIFLLLVCMNSKIMKGPGTSLLISNLI